MSQSDLFRFDVRVRERMTRRGLLSDSDLEKHLGALSDLEGRYDALPLPQPALLRVSEPAPAASQPPPQASAPVSFVRRPEPAVEPPPAPAAAVPPAPAPPAPAPAAEPLRTPPAPMMPEPAPAAVPAVTANPVEPAPVEAEGESDDDGDGVEAAPSGGPESLPPETGELDEAWEKNDE